MTNPIPPSGGESTTAPSNVRPIRARTLPERFDVSGVRSDLENIDVGAHGPTLVVDTDELLDGMRQHPSHPSQEGQRAEGQRAEEQRAEEQRAAPALVVVGRRSAISTTTSHFNVDFDIDTDIDFGIDTGPNIGIDFDTDPDLERAGDRGGGNASRSRNVASGKRSPINAGGARRSRGYDREHAQVPPPRNEITVETGRGHLGSGHLGNRPGAVGGVRVRPNISSRVPSQLSSNGSSGISSDLAHQSHIAPQSDIASQPNTSRNQSHVAPQSDIASQPNPSRNQSHSAGESRSTHRTNGPSGSSTGRNVVRATRIKRPFTTRTSILAAAGFGNVDQRQSSANPVSQYEAARADRNELHLEADERVFERFIDPRFAKRRASVARQRTRRRVRPIAFVGLLVGVLLVTVAVLLSPLVSVDRVIVRGSGSHQLRLRSVAGIEPGTPMIRADVSAAKRRLASLPEVNEVTVHRDWPSEIVIDAVMREPIVAMRSGDVVMLVATDGTVLRKAVSGENLATRSTEWSDADGTRVPLLIASPGVGIGQKSTNGAAEMVTVLAALTPSLRSRVQYVERVNNDVVLTLNRANPLTDRATSTIRVVLGSTEELPLKVRAITALMASAAVNRSASIDVSVPDVPVLKTAAKQ